MKKVPSFWGWFLFGIVKLYFVWNISSNFLYALHIFILIHYKSSFPFLLVINNINITILLFISANKFKNWVPICINITILLFIPVNQFKTWVSICFYYYYYIFFLSQVIFDMNVQCIEKSVFPFDFYEKNLP